MERLITGIYLLEMGRIEGLQSQTSCLFLAPRLHSLTAPSMAPFRGTCRALAPQFNSAYGAKKKTVQINGSSHYRYLFVGDGES